MLFTDSASKDRKLVQISLCTGKQTVSEFVFFINQF